MHLVSVCGAISRHMNDALLVIDRQGAISWSNAVFEERFGCRELCAPGCAQTLLRAPVLGMSVDETIRAKGTVALDRESRPYSLRLLQETDDSILLALQPSASGQVKASGAELFSGVSANPPAPSPSCGRRVAELTEALARAHADYRRLADTIQTLVVRYDRERRRTYVNKSFEEFHAKPAAVVQGKTAVEEPSCDAAHIADLDNKIAHVIASGESVTVDRNYVDSRGRYICSTERIVPEYDGRGAINGALLVAFGRYEEHAAKEAQREAEVTAREILDNIGSAVVLSEVQAPGEYRIVWVNRAFERMLDTPAFALVSKLSRELRQPEFGAALDALRSACLERKCVQTRTVGVGEPGARRIIDVRFFPSLERFPGRQRVIEIYRDVTKERYTHKRLHTLLDASPNLIFGASQGGSITFVSPSVCARLGGRTCDYRGRRLLDIVESFAAEACRPLVRAIKRAGEGDSDAFEVSVDALDGLRRLEFLTFAEPTAEDALESGLLLIVRDVSSLRAAEKKLRAANARLQQLRLDEELSVEDERKRIAHELHDDLGQQLTALRYSALSLGKLCDDQAPEVTASLAHIDALIDGALQSVRNVVRKLRPPALDVGLIPAVQGLIDQLFCSGDIDCDLSVVPRGLLLDDYQSLHTFRCIQEALTNIAKHSCATLAYVDIRKSDDEVCVRIGDNGKGFKQMRMRESNGLSGMHERARLLGGRVVVSSRVGIGTEVTLSYRERRPRTGGDK